MKRISVTAATIAILAIAVFALMPHPAPKLPVKTLDPWNLQTNDPYALVGQPAFAESKEKTLDGTLYGTYIGNGHIGARIGPEGVGSFNGQPTECLMSGLWKGEETQPLPNWSDFPLFDENGNRFALDTNAPYRQTLNMREGYVQTELTLKSGRQRLAGNVTVFILPTDAAAKLHALGDVAVIRYNLAPARNGKIIIKPIPHQGPVFITSTTVDTDGHNVKDSVQAKRGQSVFITRYISVSMYAEVLKSKDANLDAWEIGYDKVFAAHKQAWRDTWKSDIVIDGDPAAQQAIHAMQFYMLSSASAGQSISPMGLSTGGPWRGHIFWDADTWMFPALLLQHPNLAQGIVKYRLKTMFGAAKNAKKRGLLGTEFAWESAQTGKETAPPPYAEERHITADVGIAAHSMFGPDADLILKNTAEYWASRVKYNKVKDRYEILDIVPPDENAGIVDNSVYTNAAAKRNIELAIETAKKLGVSYPSKWDDIAKKMYIPFDAQAKRFTAYDGYKGGKTKQADTELLIYPLVYPMSDQVKKNTFDFYKKTTDPRGPAMTSSIHAIIAAELGRPDEAYKHFEDSYKPFMRGPMLIFNEKRSLTYDNACFLTGCAGTIQSVVYGFGGIRVGRAPEGFNPLLPGLSIKPCLPANWKKLEITDIKWRGKHYDLAILPGNKWDLVEKR